MSPLFFTRFLFEVNALKYRIERAEKTAGRQGQKKQAWERAINKSSKATGIYNPASVRDIGKIKSPLDSLWI